jgi:hypothetical protein
MVSAFLPVLSPRRVTIVTKFFCTDTEPQHGPYIFRSAQSFDMGQICPEPRLPDPRITAIRMIVERIPNSASPTIETSSASFPRRTNVTGLGPAEK